MRALVLTNIIFELCLGLLFLPSGVIYWGELYFLLLSPHARVEELTTALSVASNSQFEKLRLP